MVGNWPLAPAPSTIPTRNGSPGSPILARADFKNQCGRLAVVLQVMAITLTGLERGAIASIEDDIAGVGAADVAG